MTQQCFFPKMAFIDLYERAIRHKLQMNVVYYRRIKHAVVDPSYKGWNNDIFGPVKPLLWLRSLLYWDLSKLADVVVEVPKNSRRVVVRPNKKRYRLPKELASSFLYRHHHLMFALSLALPFLSWGDPIPLIYRQTLVAAIMLFMYGWH